MARLALLASLWGVVTADEVIMQQGSLTYDEATAIVLVGGLPVIVGWTNGDFPGMTNQGSNDGILVKYTLDGSRTNTLTFATANDDKVYDAATDSSNNIFVVGFTWGTLTGTNAGNADGFIVKLDNNLNQQWILQPGTTSTDYFYSVQIDSTGRVVVGGQTYGAWTAAGNAAATSNLGEWDSCILVYQTHSTREWAIQFGSAGDDHLSAIAVDTADSLDDIYATGYSDGAFEGKTNSGNEDMFLIKVGVEIHNRFEILQSVDSVDMATSENKDDIWSWMFYVFKYLKWREIIPKKVSFSSEYFSPHDLGLEILNP